MPGMRDAPRLVVGLLVTWAGLLVWSGALLARQEVSPPLGVPTPAPATGAIEEVSCRDWSSLNTDVGRLMNNVWNKAAAASFPSRQCIIKRGNDYG